MNAEKEDAEWREIDCPTDWKRAPVRISTQDLMRKTHLELALYTIKNPNM